MSTAVVLLAEGFEEIEAITPIDILRRGKINVLVAGLESLTVKGSRGISVVADCLVDQIPESFDALVLPGGGKGADHLAASAKVRKILERQHQQKKMIAAICASPAVVLTPHGILNGKKMTCHPDFKNELPQGPLYQQCGVVVDGHIITSAGAGTAFDFALAIVKSLKGEETVRSIAHATVYS